MFGISSLVEEGRVVFFESKSLWFVVVLDEGSRVEDV